MLMVRVLSLGGSKMRKTLLAALAAIILVGGAPVSAAQATKADCGALATGFETYAALADGFYKSAGSLMLAPDEQDDFPADVEQSMVSLAASRDAMLPAMADFLKALKESTAALQECATAAP